MCGILGQVEVVFVGGRGVVCSFVRVVEGSATVWLRWLLGGMYFRPGESTKARLLFRKSKTETAREACYRLQFSRERSGGVTWPSALSPLPYPRPLLLVKGYITNTHF